MAIGVNWKEIWAPVWKAVWTQSPPIPTPTPAATTPTPAGRSRRRRLFVEIDGRYFEVASEAEAQSLFAQARALAEEAAQRQADEVVKQSTPKVIRASTVKRVSLKTPKLKASPELKEAVQETRQAIYRAYESASTAAELRLLMVLAEMEADEEDVLLLLN